MSESTTIFKMVLVLGLVFLIFSTVTTPTYINEPLPANSPWGTFSNSLTGFPTFVNPFDIQPLQITTRTGYPDGSMHVLSLSGWPIEFVNCANTSFARVNCINTNDGNDTFIRVNSSGSFAHFFFNWSDPSIMLSVGADVLGYRWTFVCRTISGTGTPFVTLLGGAAFDMKWRDVSTCPRKGDAFTTVVFENSTTSGTANPNKISFNADADLVISNNVGSFVTEITFIQLELFVATGPRATGCEIPIGAWIPFLDEVACAIKIVGDIIWKGIQFIFNGLIYIGNIILYVGGIILAFFTLFTSMFAIPNTPPIIQTIITMLFIAMIAFIVFTIIKVVRGTGSTG